MAAHDESSVAAWTEARLSTLTSERELDLQHALAVLHTRRSARNRRRRRARSWIAGVAAVAALALGATPVAQAVAQQCGNLLRTVLAGPGGTRTFTRVGVRQPLPDLTLTDTAGRLVTLSSLRGRVVLLQFWAPSCVQCRTEAPWFSEFQRTYGADRLAVITVTRDRRLNASGTIPTTLLIDREGRLAVRHSGYCSKAEYAADIEALLAEQAHRY